MTEVDKKRKAQMSQPSEMVIIRGQGQQKFDLHDVLSPVQIEINDDRISNIFKKNIKRFITRLSVKNYKKQILSAS